MSDFMSVYEDYEKESLPNEGRYDGWVSDVDIVTTRAGVQYVKVEYTYEDGDENRVVEEWLRWDPGAEFKVQRRFFRALDGLGVTGAVLKEEKPESLDEVVGLLLARALNRNVNVVVHINNGYANIRGYLRRDAE